MTDVFTSSILRVKEITHVLTVEHAAHTRMHMDNRPWYGLSLAVDGRLVYTHKGKRVISDRQHVVFLPRHQSYTLECTGSGAFTLINFLLDEDIAADTFQVLRTDSPDTFLTLHKKLQAVFQSYGSAKYAKLYACFYELLASLMEEQETGRLPFILSTAIDSMEAQLADPTLSNVRIASALHISEIYLRKLFHTYLSTSPKQYIQQRRFARAQELLAGSTCTVSVIAEQCGYSTVGMFCRAFKAKLGMTPGEYREKHLLPIM